MIALLGIGAILFYLKVQILAITRSLLAVYLSVVLEPRAVDVLFRDRYSFVAGSVGGLLVRLSRAAVLVCIAIHDVHLLISFSNYADILIIIL